MGLKLRTVQKNACRINGIGEIIKNVRVQIILFFELKFTFLNNNCNVSNWVNMVIIQKPLVMQQKIGVESEFLDSQVQISAPIQIHSKHSF